MLKNNNFGSLYVNYSQNINNSLLDFGSVTLTETKSGRSFIVDVNQSYRHDNEVKCEFQDIEEMIEQKTFEGITNFDLTEDDLLSENLEVVAYCGDESDIPEPVSITLKVVVSGAEVSIRVKPD